MRINYIAIKNYKHLKNIEIDATGEEYEDDFPAFFCIGLNGSGKSAFFEAVALIFSRISQNETPGFAFELAYEINVENRRVEVRVKPEPVRGKGRLHIEIDGQSYSSFSGREMYLPYKVITCISGANSQMRRMITGEARNSILSDLYDLEMASAGNREQGASEMETLRHYLDVLEQNPRMLYLDENMAPYVIFALCAWGAEDDGYFRQRKELLKRVSGGMDVAAVSLVAGREQGGAMFRQLFTESGEDGEYGLADWVTEGEDTRTAVFRIQETGRGACHQNISRVYATPLNLLSVLLQEREKGTLQGCHFLFKSGGQGEVLDEKALSDGELLWLARMGLALAVSQEGTRDCLFLYDEPDVHLNESWNVDFISDLEKISRQKGEEYRHCFWIATHSSLLLTDALPGHVFLFKREGGEARAIKVPISLFAAGRPEISDSVFCRDAGMGKFARQKVGEMLREEDPGKILQYIDTLGPGISRVKLREKYYGRRG